MAFKGERSEQIIKGEENDFKIICILSFTHNKVSNHRSKISVKLASENAYKHLKTGKVDFKAEELILL